MATLPTIPTFADGTSPSIATLGQLSYAVQFVSDCDTRPLWHAYRNANIGLTNGAWKTIPYGQVARDSDNVVPSGAAVIVTQGYYAVEACFDIGTPTTPNTFMGSFLWTAGTHNPHFTSGTTLMFGGRGGQPPSDGVADGAICVCDICPNVCYPGDKIQPQVYVDAASQTLQYNVNTTYITQRFVANFTGLWVAEGT